MLFKTSLTKELFYTSLSTILILSGVVIAQRSVYIFRLAAKGIIPNDAIDTILVFNLLKHLPLLLSLTLFLTILITLTRWYKDSEMVIWFSSGLGLSSLIKPIIMFSLPIIVLITALSFYISPWAVHKAEEFKKGLKSRDELATITPGIFKESKSDNRIFYVEGFSELGNVVKNIFVQSIQNGKVGVIVANEGERKKNKRGEDYIIMKEGKRYEGRSNSQEFSTTNFKEYGVLVEKGTPKIISVGEVYEAKSTLELLKSDSSRYKAELYWRMSLPISALLLVFLAIPLSVINPRSGRSANIIMALLLFVIYNNLLGVSHSIVSIGSIKIWYGLWPVHLLFSSIAFYLLFRRTMNLPLLPIRFNKKI